MIVGLMLVKSSSSRFKNKNLYKFADALTLFEFSLCENLKGVWYDEFIVMSDCREVERICKMYPEVTFILEPKELAKLDDSWVVIRHVIEAAGLFPTDIVVYIPPTSPLRTARDIIGAIRLFEEHKQYCAGLVSVKKCQEPPEWSFRKEENGFLVIDKLFMTSQDIKTYYHLNGSIYIGEVYVILRNNGFFGDRHHHHYVMSYIMENEHSVNIDTPADLELAQFYLRKRRKKK